MQLSVCCVSKRFNYRFKYDQLPWVFFFAIYISENEMINPKSKHIDIRCHYTSELIKQNLANGLTNY